MSVVIQPPDWTAARCAQVGGDIWFPEKDDGDRPGQSHVREAQAICRTCPVRRECLDYALAYESGAMGTYTSYGPQGIYGGLTPNERRALLRDRREAS